MQNTIEKALNDLHLKYMTVVENDHQIVFKLGMTLENGRTDSFIDVRKKDNQVLIYAVCPTNIPPAQRARIAEFITRANYCLILGNFEMDFNDGELRFKLAYNYDDTFPPSEEVFKKSFFTSLNMLDRYLPGIMSVVYANCNPANAIMQIENASSQNPTLN